MLLLSVLVLHPWIICPSGAHARLILSTDQRAQGSCPLWELFRRDDLSTPFCRLDRCTEVLDILFQPRINFSLRFLSCCHLRWCTVSLYTSMQGSISRVPSLTCVSPWVLETVQHHIQHLDSADGHSHDTPLSD